MTYRDGMDSLARRLADRLPVHTAVRVETVEPDGAGARLHFADGRSLTARAAVLAVPAPVALRMHAALPADERPYLEACTYSTMIRVSCLLDRPLRPPRRPGRPRVYALLVPGRDDAVLSGGTVEHDKASNRCPPGTGLVSLLLAPALAAQLIDASDEEITATALAAGEAYLPGVTAASRTVLVHRFRHAQPEATPAALAHRRAFLDRPARAIEYAGDWLNLRPQSEGAVRSADLAVPRVLAHRASEVSARR
jgi:oxygen-dependent protoporphyrinogen oxidase